MRNALIFFGTLRDTDVTWLVGAGRKLELESGTQIIKENVELDSVFLILDGKFSVTYSGRQLATLSPGELIGETSFLDGGLSTASVTAMERSAVLAIDRARLRSRLDRDDGFAARVYRGFAVTVADRLRQTARQASAPPAAGSATPLRDATKEISMEVLDRSTIAANHFAEILRLTKTT